MKFDAHGNHYKGRHSDAKNTYSIEYKNDTHNILIDHIISENGQKELVWISQTFLADLHCDKACHPGGIDLLYYVNSGMIPDGYSGKAPASDGHKMFIIGELQAAIEYAIHKLAQDAKLSDELNR